MDSNTPASDARLSASGLARELGVSLPRIHRHLDRWGVPPAPKQGSARKVPQHARQHLIDSLGVAHGRAGDLSRTDIIVLAVVLRSLVGIVSARALARHAGLSPTAVGRSLDRLQERGLVRQRTSIEARGVATEVTRWHPANVGTWSDALRTAVNSVRLPAAPKHPRPERVPRELFHLLWAHPHPEQLRLPQDADYVAGRLLDSESFEPTTWALKHLPDSAIRSALTRRGTSPRAKALERTLEGQRG